MKPPAKIKRIYKFLDSQFIPGLFERGRLRIGTAKGFRIADGRDADAGRADPEELRRMWGPGQTDILAGPDHPFIQMISQGKSLPNREVLLSFEEGATIITTGSAYLFCASWEVTNKMRQRMKQELGYDACVRIRNVEEFFSTISAHPLLAGLRGGFGKVSYVATKTSAVYENVNPLEKLQRFGWQKEVRAVWEGNATDEWQIIDVPAIVPLLKRMY